MSDVKWIKICTDIFDDDKILLIENMPEADGIIVIWFKLLCMAGKHNNSGVFMMNERIAYTDEMLATIFRRPINTVRLALKVFEQYGMIEIVDGAITIPNWEKHQNLEKLEKSKELNRKRVAAYREKQRQLALQEKCNAYSNVTVMPCNDTEENREDKNREDKEKNIRVEPQAAITPTRHKYGEYKNVLLSDEDMEKLKTEFPDDYNNRIERLSEYIASTGKVYKNHLATIRCWARKEKDKPQIVVKGKNTNSDNITDFDRQFGIVL